MNNLSKFTLRLAAASVIALVPAGASLADPGLNDVPRHQHYLVTPDGDLVRIGPNVCANWDLQEAFNQFHYNLHHNFGSTPSKGPQEGAPGLHDLQAAELTSRSCTFVP